MKRTTLVVVVLIVIGCSLFFTAPVSGASGQYEVGYGVFELCVHPPPCISPHYYGIAHWSASVSLSYYFFRCAAFANMAITYTGNVTLNRDLFKNYTQYGYAGWHCSAPPFS